MRKKCASALPSECRCAAGRRLHVDLELRGPLRDAHRAALPAQHIGIIGIITGIIGASLPHDGRARLTWTVQRPSRAETARVGRSARPSRTSGRAAPVPTTRKRVRRCAADAGGDDRTVPATNASDGWARYTPAPVNGDDGRTTALSMVGFELRCTTTQKNMRFYASPARESFASVLLAAKSSRLPLCASPVFSRGATRAERTGPCSKCVLIASLGRHARTTSPQSSR